MNIRQLTISTIAVILTAFTLGVTAGPGNKDNRGMSGHEQQKDKPDKQQVVDSREHNRDSDDRWHNDNRDRDDDDGWGRGDYRYNQGWRSNDHKGNENSNRQSDPDSTRGLERAAERRSDNANQHVQSEEERPRRWYDFMTGRDGDRVKNREVTERQSRWWWPFD